MDDTIPNKIEQALIVVLEAAKEEARTQEFEEEFEVVKKVLDACRVLENHFDL